MRRHLEAPPANMAVGRRFGIRKRGLGFAALCLAGLLAAALLVGPAAGAAEPCANEALRQAQQATFLPECRAYEMVSPVSKGGVDVLGDTLRPFTEAGPDGNTLAYGSPAAFSDAKGAAFPSIYRAVRSGSGWTSTVVSPPQNATLLGGLGGGNTSMVSDLSADLTGAIVRTNRSLAPGASEDVPNIYRHDLLNGGFDLLTPGGPTEIGLESILSTFASATPDLSAVVFNSRDALTPDAPVGSEPKVYVYRNGSVELASVLPGEVPANGFAGDESLDNTRGTISDDGRLVFFELREAGESKGLYVRDLDAETTTEIVEPGIRTRFLAASTDGSKVLWKATEPIANSELLFVYDVETGETTMLPDYEPSDSLLPVWTVLAVSPDLDSVYFVQKGKLVAGQPDPPVDAPAGEMYGLYRWQPESGEITFVTNFSGGSTNGDRLQFEGGIFDSLATRRDVAISPDGSVLAFATDSKVMPPGEAGYENQSAAPVCDDGGEERCREVYRFSAADDSVVCVSCPDGTPTTNAGLPGAESVRMPSTMNQKSFAQAHAVSADGADVFFDSGERLAPGDSNGRDDVYMWRDGERHLLSGGSSQYQSRLIEVSPSGDDVFFVTRERLAGWDRDELADVYDARVGGGFAEPPPVAPGCQGSACQGPAIQGPAALTPASALVNGRGNARPCRRGHKPRRTRKAAKASAQRDSKKKRSRASKCRGAK